MKNKKIVTKPFDRFKIPPKQNILIMPIIWLYCFIVTKRNKLKINKVRMKGVKPPYLVLGTHQSFMDFCVTPLTIFPRRANYVSELEGFEAYGEWKYRQIGCLGTRKFVYDLALVKNIKRVIARKGILVLYPEARYANVGTYSPIPKSVGKLAKMLKVTVVIVNMKGNYLRTPIWNLNVRKEVPLEATITQIFTKEELQAASLKEVNDKISEYLYYDEYKWQYDEKISITYEKRAEGIEMPLYKCPVCGEEFHMKTNMAHIFCEKCNSKWYMTEYGKLEPLNNKYKYLKSMDFSHIPNWYEWERSEVIKEIKEGRYFLDINVYIESLPNGINFIKLGHGKLVHNKDGFYLTFTDYGEKNEKTMFFSRTSMTSIHTEYNYRGKGQCITLSTLDNTYFIFPRGDGFNATKIQFATEYLYDHFIQ